MLSSHNLTAAQAATYYEKDDYYTQEMGSELVSKFACYWYGNGAQALNLEGPVQNSDFQSLLEGYDPTGNSLHAKPIDPQKHRAATDFTFSAPKSISIAALVQQDERVIAAHDHAVQTALDVMQSRYAQARTWNPQTRSQERTPVDNLTVAVFRHETSRNQEPQLHSHAVVINAVQLDDGTWRALSNEAIVANKKLLGEIYQNEFAYQLHHIGYEIEPHPNGQFDLKYYTPELLDNFSTRRHAIEAYVEASHQPKTTKLYEQATLHTRTRKTVLPRELLLEAWHHAIQQNGLDLPPIPLTEAATRVTQTGTSAEIAACDGIAHAEEREAVFRRGKVEQFALEHYLGQHSWSELQTAIEQTNELIRADAIADRWTTQTAIQRELDTLRLMQQGKGTVRALAPLEEAIAICPETLTKGQREALIEAATTTDSVMAWQGVAGAGKTYALQLYRQLAEQNGFSVQGFSPSAAGANVLQTEAGLVSDTVAALVYAKEMTPTPDQIWVIDEASLLSAKECHVLLQRAEQVAARVLFVGDTRQLSAVDAGHPFRSLQAAGMQTVRLDESVRQKNETLKQAIHVLSAGDLAGGFQQLLEADAIRAIANADERHQAIAQTYLNRSLEKRAKTLILANTHAERAAITQRIRTGLKTEGALSADILTLTSLKPRDLTLAEAAHARHYNPGDVIVPLQTYKKQGLVRGQHYEIQSVDVAQNRLTLKSPTEQINTIDPACCEKKKTYLMEPLMIAQGDRLRWTRTDRATGVCNGQEFQVDAVVENGQAIVRYRDNKTALIDLSGQQFVDYDYVSTTYSAQGRTADSVLATLDQFTGKESFYVAASRARQSLTIYTADVQALQQFAARSRANKNPSDYIDLLTYQEHRYATYQTRNQATATGGTVQTTSAGHTPNPGEFVGDRVAHRLAATLPATRGTGDPTDHNAADESKDNQEHDSNDSVKQRRRAGDGWAPLPIDRSGQCTDAAEPERSWAEREYRVEMSESGTGYQPTEPQLQALDQQLQQQIERINERLNEFNRYHAERRARLKQQAEWADQILKTATALFEVYMQQDRWPEVRHVNGDLEFDYPVSINHVSYTVRLEGTPPSYNVYRDGSNLTLQQQGITETDVQNWQDIQTWLDEGAVAPEEAEPEPEDAEPEPEPDPPLQIDSMQVVASLTVAQWNQLAPREQLDLAKAAIDHARTEPQVTTHVEQWTGQAAAIHKDVRSASQRVEQSQAAYAELEQRGSRSLLNPFGASADQQAEARDVLSQAQSRLRAAQTEYQKMVTRQERRQHEEKAHQDWQALPETQVAQHVLTLLQQPEVSTQFERVKRTLKALYQWQDVAPQIGRPPEECEFIRTVTENYLDGQELDENLKKIMQDDLQHYRQQRQRDRQRENELEL